MYNWVIFGLFVILTAVNCQQYALYECPAGWEEYADRCFRYIKDPQVDRDIAQANCAMDGSTLISVNDAAEDLSIVNTLLAIDTGQIKLIWWTSGQRVSTLSDEFYWEGDGTKVESFMSWHNDSIPQDKSKEYIQYYYDGYKWAWILSRDRTSDTAAYICEISKEDIYKISGSERGPDYGLDNTNPETVPRGPLITTQPEDTIYEPNDVDGYVSLDCYADSYPPASYTWNIQRAGENHTIDPVVDTRYTIINGRLIIHNPSAEFEDDGKYQCTAMNEFGSILSNTVSLNFGYLQDFPKSPRAPVDAISYQWASIECSPPAHYPDILYTWYKNDIYNFIRPEYKPYMFISHDGRLYFSEVTTDDVGNYYCLVYKPGQDQSMGKVSMPTELRVNEGSPGVYEPQIGSSFPLIYPISPRVGDQVRLECWASGTSVEYDLMYSWDKMQLKSGSTNEWEKMPLPLQAQLSDHNRVVTIPNITPYDAGRYMCNVYRVNGQSTNKTVNLVLWADPDFSLELTGQFADINSKLTWRCDANGEPAPEYSWLKNTLPFNNQTIPPADTTRISVDNNVLTIDPLDPKDDAMYQCIAENEYGLRYTTGQLAVLSFAPTFNKYPLQPNQFCTMRGNTTLYCKPEAAPYPIYEDIIWYKDEALLNPGQNEGDRVQKLVNGNLLITNVQLSDQGRYRCHVTNAYGESETLGNLTVLTTVSLTTPPMDTGITVNSSTFLHCVASYSLEQDVTYVWYHADILVEFERIYRLGENKFEIWYNPHYRRGSGINLGGIYVMNAQHEHGGFYTCRIEAGSGSMEKGANLYVLGPPSQPAGVFKDDISLTTNSIIVQWKAAGNNGDPIMSYVIEALNYWEGFWKVLVTNVQATPDEFGTMTYNVTTLQAYSQYQIRMRAENKLGTSEPSQPTGPFTTYGVIPDRAPDEVGGGEGKVGVLTITWKPLPEWEHNGPGFGYRIFLKEAGDEDWDRDNIYQLGNIGQYTHLVGQNNYYRMYEVAVLAYNQYGQGPISPTVTIRSSMSLPNIIAKNVLAQPQNATACSVHWIPVEDTRENLRGKLSGYRISYWKECCEVEENAPRVTVEGQTDIALVIGLDPDTPYYFDVMVFNEAGNGPKSEYFIQRTLRQAPIDMPVEVQIERRSDTSIFVEFRGVSTTQLEEPLEGYMVRLWTDGVHLKEGVDYDAERETTLLIDGLQSNVYYKLRVYGYSRAGMGAMSYPALKFIIGRGNPVVASVCLLFICFFTTKVILVFT